MNRPMLVATTEAMASAVADLLRHVTALVRASGAARTATAGIDIVAVLVAPADREDVGPDHVTEALADAG